MNELIDTVITEGDELKILLNSIQLHKLPDIVSNIIISFNENIIKGKLQYIKDNYHELSCHYSYEEYMSVVKLKQDIDNIMKFKDVLIKLSKI